MCWWMKSKQADIENLGECLRVLGDGQSLGDFSLTIVLYGRSREDIDQLVAEFTGVFTNADSNLFAETYNQLNAYLATVPGNYAMNLRQLYMLNTKYADLSFLFTILPGEKTNEYLGTEYTGRCSKQTTARLTSSTCIPATLLIP